VGTLPLKKPDLLQDVILMMLWKECRDRCREKGLISVCKTKFFDDHARYCQANDISNHLNHNSRERCKVNWSGSTMKIIHRFTEEAQTVYLFVNYLSYSHYAYVGATPSMKIDT
jgi:hypothetical protein